MDIWCVDSKDWTSLMLWRMDDGFSFRVIQAGTYEPVLGNADYAMINKSMPLYLKLFLTRFLFIQY